MTAPDCCARSGVGCASAYGRSLPRDPVAEPLPWTEPAVKRRPAPRCQSEQPHRSGPGADSLGTSPIPLRIGAVGPDRRRARALCHSDPGLSGLAFRHCRTDLSVRGTVLPCADPQKHYNIKRLHGAVGPAHHAVPTVPSKNNNVQGTLWRAFKLPRMPHWPALNNTNVGDPVFCRNLP
jgi:hypothetical protein